MMQFSTASSSLCSIRILLPAEDGIDCVVPGEESVSKVLLFNMKTNSGDRL